MAGCAKAFTTKISGRCTNIYRVAWRRADSVLCETVGGRAVLIDAAGNELITLNPVGSLVWAELDGRRDVAQLSHDLLDRVDGVTQAQFERDIETFVAKLAAIDLVATDEAS
jgi:Coenzyme PQQ synthesis protein D (PqqD)